MADADATDTPSGADETGEDVPEDVESLRRQVEEKYDFDDFGPADMREMTVEEWEAAFDADSWLVGRELLERVERELRQRIATREVFAVLEWVEYESERCLLAYSDEGYALVRPDGSVEGRGTVLRDVKPSVALCSMDDYEVGDPPADVSLPHPDEVPEGSGELGNHMLQAVAAVQVLAGLGLLFSWLFLDLPGQRATAKLIFPTVGIGFLLVGVFLFAVVANARLSDRFRAVEYRDRLRAVGLDDGERPDFLPVDADARLDDVSGDDSG
ncbi:MAG: hypothetical protein ABEJ22_02325 [Haloferacaceae archaeon]